MFFKLFAILLLSEQSFGENVFFRNLEKLFDYCLAHRDEVDSGTLLGVSFAKGILSSGRQVEGTEKLIGKIETLLDLEMETENLFSELNEIGRNIFL